MSKPIREPLYGCENGFCAEEHTNTADMLKVHEGKLWCDTCWGYDNPTLIEGETAIEWGDLEPFVPDHIVDANKIVRGYGMTPKGEPMPQTIEEWKHLVDLDELALHKLVTEIGVLKAKVSRLKQQNDSLRSKQGNTKVVSSKMEHTTKGGEP
tara:strand:- start:202 stop:660 length:459 start_codon:yes stop_codon:yes gene_type:complete